MEILQFLLNYFLSDYNDGLAPFVKRFVENKFDFKKTISQIEFSDLLSLLGSLTSTKKQTPTDSVGENDKFKYIRSFASKDIVDKLDILLNR